jgi:predicted nucleotidyltransferase
MGTRESHRGPSGKTLPPTALSLKDALAKLKVFFQHSEAVLAYLFGSYAQGEAGRRSDVDIAVLLEGDAKKLYELHQEVGLGVRDALGTERFDLLLLNDAPPALEFEVISTGRLLYARSDQDLNAFEANVVRAYLDTAHLRAVQNEYLRRRAKEWYSANE